MHVHPERHVIVLCRVCCVIVLCHICHVIVLSMCHVIVLCHICHVIVLSMCHVIVLCHMRMSCHFFEYVSYHCVESHVSCH